MTKAHLERPAVPWREPHLTVCGRPLIDTPRWVKWGEAWDRLGDEEPCGTCSKRAWDLADWAKNPGTLLLRELERLEWSDHGEVKGFIGELRAIAELVALHRDEFEQLQRGEVPITRRALEREFERRRQELIDDCGSDKNSAI